MRIPFWSARGSRSRSAQRIDNEPRRIAPPRSSSLRRLMPECIAEDRAELFSARRHRFVERRPLPARESPAPRLLGCNSPRGLLPESHGGPRVGARSRWVRNRPTRGQTGTSRDRSSTRRFRFPMAGGAEKRINEEEATTERAIAPQPSIRFEASYSHWLGDSRRRSSRSHRSVSIRRHPLRRVRTSIR